MFRLYGGLVREGVWYNHAKLVDVIKGGMFAILGGRNNDTGADKILKLIKASVKKIYTEDGQEYELQEKDYVDFLMCEGFKIGMEVMKKLLNTKYPKFKEYFFCPRCSTEGNQRYTEVCESWDELIEKGLIDENFIEDPKDLEFTVELPVGITLPDSAKYQSGTFNKLTRRHITIEKQIEINDTPECVGDYSRQLQAKWDQEIIAIEGVSEQTLNHYKRRLSDSFCDRFLIHQDDIAAMVNASMRLGIDATDRKIKCSNCNHLIGGDVDFTNFFSFLLPGKMNPASQQITD